jgi:hypothetical protein
MQLNKEFNGQLNLAIQVFEGDYHRKYVAADIKSVGYGPMDYLKRDSFLLGWCRRNVNSERLIK